MDGTLAMVLGEIEGLTDEAVAAINTHLETYWPETKEDFTPSS